MEIILTKQKEEIQEEIKLVNEENEVNFSKEFNEIPINYIKCPEENEITTEEELTENNDNKEIIQGYMKFLAKTENEKIDEKGINLLAVYWAYMEFIKNLSGQNLIAKGKNFSYFLIYFNFIDLNYQLINSPTFVWNQYIEEKFTKLAQESLQLFYELGIEDNNEENGIIEEGKRKIKWRKLCLLHNFVYYVLNEAIKINNKELLDAVMKLIGINNNEKEARNNYDCNSRGQVKKVIEKYQKKNGQLVLIHKNNLTKLIYENIQIRHFLCHNLSKIKLVKLIDIETLASLEIKFPDILQIHILEPSLHEKLFKNILRIKNINDKNNEFNKIFNVKIENADKEVEKACSFIAEIRLFISLLLNKYIEKTNKIIKENKQLENKLKNIFSSICESMSDGQLTIYMLIESLKIIDDLNKYTETQRKIKLDEWIDKFPQKIENSIEEYSEQNKLIGDETIIKTARKINEIDNYKYLFNKFKSDKNFLEKIKTNNGKIAILSYFLNTGIYYKKLVYDDFNIIDRNCNTVCKIITPQCFLLQKKNRALSLLDRQLLINFVALKILKKRLINKLASDFIVWYRCMRSELRNKQKWKLEEYNYAAAKKFDSEFPFIYQLYDLIYIESYNDIKRRISGLLIQIMSRIKNRMYKDIQSTSIDIELEEIELLQINKNDENKSYSTYTDDNLETMEKWLKERHLLEMKELIMKNVDFSEEMKKKHKLDLIEFNNNLSMFIEEKHFNLIFNLIEKYSKNKASEKEIKEWDKQLEKQLNLIEKSKEKSQEQQPSKKKKKRNKNKNSEENKLLETENIPESSNKNKFKNKKKILKNWKKLIF
ncbi:hypothetical protein Mgra_00008351, partial [Meloidogyne graminicola]